MACSTVKTPEGKPHVGKAWLVCSPSTRDLARCRPPENRVESTGDESPAGSGWGTCAWLHSSGFHPACRPASTSLIIRWGDKSSNPPRDSSHQSWCMPGARQGYRKAVSCGFNLFEHVVPFKPDRPGDRHQIWVRVATICWDDHMDNSQ